MSVAGIFSNATLDYTSIQLQFQSQQAQVQSSQNQSGSASSMSMDRVELSETVIHCSAISASGTAANSSSNPIATDYSALGQALQSGDLAGAQKAFSSLEQDLTNWSQTNGTGSSSSNSPSSTQTSLNNDYKALAQALQSGNLSDAQTAFSSVQQDLQNIQQGQGHHHHGHSHHGGSSQGSDSEISGLLASLSSSQTNSTSTASASGSLAQDFSALGQALQSGNLSDAQKAYASVQQDLQNAQPTGSQSFSLEVSSFSLQVTSFEMNATSGSNTGSSTNVSA
jgi:outer membrane protein assembly factor BamD (BamD/ComL family)